VAIAAPGYSGPESLLMLVSTYIRIVNRRCSDFSVNAWRYMNISTAERCNH